MIAIWRAACAVAVIIGSVATPARAAWFEATTNHFIVEADAPEERVRDFAMRLEKFDRALHLLYGVEDDPSRKSNRVQVFAAGADNVRRMCGPECPDGVAGFYHSEAGGSVIFTSMLSGAAGGPDDLSPQAVLLHEYSHHFMYSNFPIAYPFWFSEGFAEFNERHVRRGWFDRPRPASELSGVEPQWRPDLRRRARRPQPARADDISASRSAGQVAQGSRDA